MRELEQFEAALKANPGDVDVVLRAADCCLRAGGHEQAAALYLQAMALAPTRIEPYTAMTELLRGQDMHADAIEMLQRAIERNPEAVELWHAIAQVMIDLDDVDNALTFLGEALRLQPDVHACRLRRAELYRTSGEHAAALADYEYLRVAMPHDPRALVGWGDVKALMGHRGDARIAYTAVMGLARDTRPLEDRLQRLAIMEFARPLPRHDLPEASASAAGAPRSDNLNIVFFHADAPASLGPFEKPDYQAMLTRAVAVARTKAPGARIVLLSDEATRFAPDLPVDRIVRRRLNLAQLMYERMRMERDFLASPECTGDTVFLDSDVIVNRDPAEIFDGSFDVALTWRSDPPEAPFNGGVALYRKTPGALRFYDNLIATHHELERFAPVVARFPEGMRRWWGHQLAMAATVGWNEFARRQSDRMSVDGSVVRFLPERIYNFAMAPTMPLSMPRLERRFFMHFKGARKTGFWRYAGHVLGDGVDAPPAPAVVTGAARPAVDPRFTTYDLGVAPISYDVTWFLALAHNRGVKHIDIVPGAHFGFRDDGWYQKADVAEKQFRMWNIIVPACQLAGMTVTVHRDRTKAAATVYKMRPIVEEGITEDVFHASAHSKRWVARWLEQRGLSNPVVIVLRESHWPSRDSNMDAWRRFAAEMNAVVIPDTDGATAFGHVFDGINMDRRLALYEAASVVAGVGGGPLALCWLSRSIPYLTFKMVSDYPAATPDAYLRQGFPVGSQFKWAGPHQRLVWEDDSYEAIRRAYDEFLAATGRR